MLSMSDFALSTMWNYPSAKTGVELVQSIANVGFSKVELNYQVREELLPSAEVLLSTGIMKVVSLHNVFPKTNDKRFGTDSVLLGYLDEDLRRQSVCYTKHTLDWAARLGAKAVVLHPTEVPLDPDEFDKPLKSLIKDGRRNTAEYRDLFSKLLQRRHAAPYLAALTRSLQELCDYIANQNYGIYLGLENRSMCHQIPLFGEYEAIFDEFSGSPAKLWLDTGHGILMEEIGLQRMPLPTKLQDQLIGVHIHDAQLGRDHYLPGLLQSDMLLPYFELIAKAEFKVMEVSSRYTAQEVRKGTTWLIERMNQWEFDGVSYAGDE